MKYRTPFFCLVASAAASNCVPDVTLQDTPGEGGSAGKTSHAGSSGRNLGGDDAAGAGADGGATGGTADGGRGGRGGGGGGSGGGLIGGRGGNGDDGGIGGGGDDAGGLGGGAGETSGGASGSGGDSAGAGGSGGTTGAPSCAGFNGTECSGDDCCASPLVEGGSFPMGRASETCPACNNGCPPIATCFSEEQPEHEAIVASFRLDRYEVTVRRFRAYLAAFSGAPSEGAGKHPLLDDSGWQDDWPLAASADEITPNLACHPTAPWTDDPGTNEDLPIDCMNWFEAFAFCVWDGGRLPTEAEWEYAAAGGNQNRVFPWGSDEPNATRASYMGSIRPVGYASEGLGRYGQLDLAGSMAELLLDWYDGYGAGTCDNCANLTNNPWNARVVRGGHWEGPADNMRSAFRNFTYKQPAARDVLIGFRCARQAP